jgi:CubicO group peptidase (beta-lactamase class C family)
MVKRNATPPLVHGSVSPGFEEVAIEFRRNFTRRDELGAACTVYVQGEKVIDLWGGHMEPARRSPWQEDTLLLMFSVSKGISALCLALAHSRGHLDYEERVAAYWPEFGAMGKEQITVRQLLAHQAGLCAIDTPLKVEELADLDHVAAIIGRQKPAWKPGEKHGYHALSLGLYEGELIRRVDPQKRSLGQFLRDEMIRPLALEFYIGLPASVPEARIATVKTYRLPTLLLHLDSLPFSLVRAFLTRSSLTARTFGNPSIDTRDYNIRPVQAVEMPASNGIGQVRSVAKLYSVFAMGGGALGIRPETMAAIVQPPTRPTSGSIDQVLKVPTAYSLGFLRPSSRTPFGSSSRSFGASGAGGSFAFADPEKGVGYAYGTNKMGHFLRSDPRERAIQTTLYRCLEKIS